MSNYKTEPNYFYVQAQATYSTRESIDFYFGDLDNLINQDFRVLDHLMFFSLYEDLKDYHKQRLIGNSTQSVWFKRWQKYLPENFEWDNDNHWKFLETSVQYDFLSDLYCSLLSSLIKIGYKGDEDILYLPNYTLNEISNLGSIIDILPSSITNNIMSTLKDDISTFRKTKKIFLISSRKPQEVIDMKFRDECIRIDSEWNSIKRNMLDYIHNA